MYQQTTTLLDLPYLPDVPGLILRTWRGETDLEAMREVLVEAENADGERRAVTIEDMQHSYGYLENCDLERDIIIVEINGAVVGYGRCFWGYEPTEDRYTYHHFGWIVPSARRQGIGTAMMHYFEERLREHAEAHPADKVKVFHTFAHDTQAGKHRVLEGLGYEAVAYDVLMNRPLDEPIPDHSLPGDLAIRPMTPDEYRTVIFANNENFREHRGYEDLTESNLSEWMESRYFQPELWMVAWDGSTPVGNVGNFIDEEENSEFNLRRGWTETISVAKDYRGRGVAKALITESMRMFKEMGMDEVALGVHTGNPTGAYRLYQSLGYRKMRGGRQYEKPLA